MDEIDPMPPSEIKKLRQELGWTLERMAIEFGVRFSTVYRWEQDRTPGGPATRLLYILRYNLMQGQKGLMLHNIKPVVQSTWDRKPQG